MSRSLPSGKKRLNAFETLEARQVMSADPLGGMLGGTLEQHAFANEPPMVVHQTEPEADFWIDRLIENRLDQQLDNIEQLLDSAHNLTGLNNVRANYGFTGAGQTVAIIDSGIAYDHYALGGGFGSDYRVVGGWDFTEEKDADPYDDGTEGSHGTHVAGIVGSTGNNSGGDVGVAPGVDLVGLRVFNDAGAGYFSWVENALKWVHENRNSFENPITAVNLSLGTSWNSTTLPNWTTLEDDFARLEADGIFISVSAGNSFASYNTPGLSYPAASSHVVPVMSVDDSGALSYFSQRHTSAIAAPGRFVRSTVPDYAGNHNGVADDWANFSGTSMASPYVAGSSVLVREAMQFVGYTDITQDTIYDHIMATADSFFDSATSLTYKRLNLANAIDALMPVDDFGSSVIDAYNMGSVGADTQLSGHIARLNDADYFSFTAAATGQFTFTATTTHQMTAQWDAAASGGIVSGGQFSIDVVAGQSYTFGLRSAGGLGYYDLNATFEPGMSFVDWGAVAGQSSYTNLTANGEQWYRIVAGQSGYMTSTAKASNGTVSLAYYSASGQMLVNGSSTSGGQRVDMLATAGQEVYLQVAGTSSSVDVTCTNLVSVAGSQLTVGGTDADDTISLALGSSYVLTVNGVEYTYVAAAISNTTIDGGVGNDSITITGSTANETYDVASTGLTLDSTGLQLSATGFETVVLNSGGGLDTVTLNGTVGNDLFTAFSSRASLVGTGFSYTANHFANVLAIAGGGNDTAKLYDSAGDDIYTGWSDRVVMSGTNYSNEARGFDNTTTYATTGNDVAHLYDTAGNDIYTTWWNRAIMFGTGYWNDVRGFDQTIGYATTGSDDAYLRDSAGDDQFVADPGLTTMTGSGYSNQARGFDRSFAFASAGHDVATLNDSAGDDIYGSWHDRAVLYGAGYWSDARNFDQTIAIATTGYDTAYLRDTAGDDQFTAWHDRAVMSGTGFANEVRGFDQAIGAASTGNDVATMYDSAGDDTYSTWTDRAVMFGTGYWNDARGFDSTVAFANGGGNDLAYLRDSAGDDQFVSWSDRAVMSGTGFSHDVRLFERVLALTTTGYDTAVMHDSAGDDIFTNWPDRALMMGSGYQVDARNFDSVTGIASTGNDFAALRDSAGKDIIRNTGSSLQMTGSGFAIEATGFGRTYFYDLFANDDDDISLDAYDAVFSVFDMQNN